jgi:hypothetical protein
MNSSDLGPVLDRFAEMRRTLDEFLNDPVASGGSVNVTSRGGAWIRIHDDTVTLEGEFTPYELIRIIAAFNRDKKAAE